jgi:hypothetical protein
MRLQCLRASDPWQLSSLAWSGVMSMARSYSSTQKVTFGERFGMIVGGGAVLGLLTFQIIFVARLAGF